MEFKCLGKKDIIVVNGGTNDHNNNSERRKSALVHMLQFAQKYVNTNIIMVSIPPRHDIAMDSQINFEIQDFNMKLCKSAKLFRHVELVEMNFNRKYFTKHGFYLNNAGKEGLAKVIASQINKIINCSSNENPVISLQWKEESIDKSIIVNTTHSSTQKTAVDNSPKLESPLIQTYDSQQELIGSECTRRISNRQKKATVSRNSDFFMVNTDTDCLTFNVLTFKCLVLPCWPDFFGHLKLEIAGLHKNRYIFCSI